MSRLSSLTEALLDAAKKAGAEAADAMALSGTSQSIDIRAGALEQAERSEDVEIGLRVLIGGQQACVSASDTSPATLARLAERARGANAQKYRAIPANTPRPTERPRCREIHTMSLSTARLLLSC